VSFALIESFRGGRDFEVYRLAAMRFWDAEPLYRLSDGNYPFKYAPPSAWLFTLWACLPGLLARLSWNALSAAALIAVMRRLSSTRWTAGVAALVLGPSIVLVFYWGQVDLILLWLLVAADQLDADDHAGAAGFCWAIAIMWKPPAALLAIHHLIHKRYRPLWYATIASAVLWLPVLVRYQVDGTLALSRGWHDLVAGSTAAWIGGDYPQGIPTVLIRLFTHGVPSERAVLAAQLVPAAALAALLRWRRPAPPVSFAIVCVGVALFSPLAWRANFVMAFPATLLLIAERRNWGLLCVVVAPGLLYTMSRELGDLVLVYRPYTIAFLALALFLLWSRQPIGDASSAAECA
jgi:hypothetical protein